MINIIVADDHMIIREGLVELLSRDISIKVVGQARDGMEAVELCTKLKPDMIIMDIGMPLLNGIDATKLIRKRSKDTKIIILSMYNDNDTILRATESGISGFILKTGTSKELINAIYTISNKKMYFSPKISVKTIEKIQTKLSLHKSNMLDNLTMKEKHILQLIAEGHSTKKIANLLKVSFHTVKSHRNHLMEKLNLHNIANLTHYAFENRIITRNR